MTVASHETYTINNQLTFILTDTKIIVKTPYQTNLVAFATGNYKRRWEKLNDKIRRGEIKTISQLISYNQPKVVGQQIQGLILIPTKLERYV